MSTVADDDTTPRTMTPLGHATRSHKQTTYIHKTASWDTPPAATPGSASHANLAHQSIGTKTTTYLAQPHQTKHNAARDNGYPKCKSR